MKRYPWLEKIYKQIIYKHQNNTAPHAILIRTQKGIGVFSLIWSLSQWLLCSQPKGIDYCTICHSCKLMSLKNHPDWHRMSIQNEYLIGVDDIRKINQKIFRSPKQGKSKVVFFSNTKELTEHAINALLKTLEEPPHNTWFFIIDYKYLPSHSTLRSRCVIYRLLPPKEKNSIKWLSNIATTSNISNIIALRTNQLSPISAKKFIYNEIWNNRKKLYKYLLYAINNSNLLIMLPILLKKNTILQIDWIYFLLSDAIKNKFNEKKKLINLDQLKLINFFSYYYSDTILHKSISIWIKCRHRLLHVIGINEELLLLEQLLTWENILNIIKIH